MTCLEAALTYLNKGFSIIPVNPSKKSFIKWEPYQKTKPTIQEVTGWFSHWPNAGIAIVTGDLSGICVIDVDDPNQGMATLSEYLTLSEVPTVRTPRGFHLYFRAPEKCPGNAAGCPKGVDFRGQGGYIVAPPSRNGTAKGYEWLPGLSLEEIVPPPLPIAFINLLKDLALKGYRGEKVNQEQEEHTKAHESTKCLRKGAEMKIYLAWLIVLLKIIGRVPKYPKLLMYLPQIAYHSFLLTRPEKKFYRQ